MLFGLLKSLDEKVKEDKERLLSKLKSSDIKTLIMEMGNNELVSENVIEKRKRDMSFSSDDFICWFAFKVSDELSDRKLKSELIQLLNEQNFLNYKPHILGCLSSLCVNTKDYELFDFLISELQKTQNEEIITIVLSRLEKLRKPNALNIDYIINLLQNGTGQNRISALKALQNSEHSELENILIQEFKKSDQHTKEMICATLRSTGTLKSFDVLKTELKRTRSNNLKYFIESAIEEISKRENQGS